MKVYFAHPVNTYNTELEQQVIDAILVRFPGAIVENSNHPHHETEYQRYKQERGNGMLYYIEEVLPKCDVIVALSYLDGRLGSGVATEAQFFLDHHKPTWGVAVSRPSRHLFFMGLSPNYPIEGLSVEETRARNKQPYFPESSVTA